MVVKTNDARFTKTPPPKRAGHKQGLIKQDTYALFRESNGTNLHILNAMKIVKRNNTLQIDVILRSENGEMSGITYMLTDKSQSGVSNIDNIRYMLLEPTISAQLNGYVFTYNFTMILEAIAKKYKFIVKRYENIMDKQYLSLYDATPSKYLISEDGIIGCNSLESSGTLYSVTLGQNVIGELYIQALRLEPTRRKHALNVFNNRTNARGATFNIRVLEREIGLPIKFTLLETPIPIEEYEM